MCKNILDVAADKGQPVDFHDLMFKFTLDSFVLYVNDLYSTAFYEDACLFFYVLCKLSHAHYRLGFGVQLNGLRQKEKVPFAESFDFIQYNSSWRLVFPIWKLTESIKPILTPWKMQIKDHVRIVDTFAYEVIGNRKKEMAEGKEFKDLLSRFMTTRDDKNDLLDDKGLRDVILNFIGRFASTGRSKRFNHFL